jgi:hypothetical protein
VYSEGEGAEKAGGGEEGAPGPKPRYGGWEVYDGGYWLEPKDGWRWKPGVGAAAAEWSISEDGEKAIGTGL